MDTAFLLGQLFNGFSVASLYVLAALGLALSGKAGERLLSLGLRRLERLLPRAVRAGDPLG